MDMESSSTKFQFIFLYPLGIDFVSSDYHLSMEICAVYLKFILEIDRIFFQIYLTTGNFIKIASKHSKKLFFLISCSNFQEKEKRKKQKIGKVVCHDE